MLQIHIVRSCCNRLEYLGTQTHLNAVAINSSLQYHGSQSYCTATAGTVGCSTKGLSLPLCYSWYSRLQYQGTQSTTLLQLVQ